MKRTAWSGRVPADEDDARRRILDAAVRCVHRDGVRGTSVGKVASEAGVSRPTVYAYFGSREEIVSQAVLEASAAFVGRVVAHARTFVTAADRLVEATLFAMAGIATEPALAARFPPGRSTGGPISSEELAFATLCLEPVAELAPALAAWMDDAAEVAVRVLISLVGRPPRAPRDEAADRAFLHRWWPQALGLAPGGAGGVAAGGTSGAGAGAGPARGAGG